MHLNLLQLASISTVMGHFMLYIALKHAAMGGILFPLNFLFSFLPNCFSLTLRPNFLFSATDLSMYIYLDSPLVSTEIQVKQIKRNAKMIPQSEISQIVIAVKRMLMGEKQRKQARDEPGKQQIVPFSPAFINSVQWDG